MEGSAKRNGTSRSNEESRKAAWIEGARLLSEEGRLAWLLGRSLYEALGNLSAESVDSPEAILAHLRVLVSRARIGRDVAHTVEEPASDPGAASPREATPLNWPGIVQQRLDKRSYPVVFVGSQCIRGRFASLALGIDLGGYKHVLGGRDDGKTAELVWDLARRKLNAQSGLLVVTDGSRQVDGAVEQAWHGLVQVQHCLYVLRQDLKDHTPASLHGTIHKTLQTVGRLGADEAREALALLVEELHVQHPGAAARLERSIEKALTVARLGVSIRLRSRLQSQGAIRVAFKQALLRSKKGASGLSAITSGIGAWLERCQRFRGHEELPKLAERLCQENLR